MTPQQNGQNGTSRIRRRWTEQEDQVLRVEADFQLSQGALKDWNRIAAKLPGRTNKDCRKRYSKVCEHVKKGAWSPAEDKRLQAGVEQCGFRWTQVAKVVRTRHADQCAKRWQHSLDPNLDHSEWKQEDDERLIAAVAEHGRNWKLIGEKEFPSRSTTDIKNRYAIADRKREKAAANNPQARGINGIGSRVRSNTLNSTTSATTNDTSLSSTLSSGSSSPASSPPSANLFDMTLTDFLAHTPRQPHIHRDSSGYSSVIGSTEQMHLSPDLKAVDPSAAGTLYSLPPLAAPPASPPTFNLDMNDDPHGLAQQPVMPQPEYTQFFTGAPEDLMATAGPTSMAVGAANPLGATLDESHQNGNTTLLNSSMNWDASLPATTVAGDVSPPHIMHRPGNNTPTNVAGNASTANVNFGDLGNFPLTEEELNMLGMVSSNGSNDSTNPNGGGTAGSSGSLEWGPSYKTTLTLDDVPPQTLNQVLDVLFKSRTRVKMETYQ